MDLEDRANHQPQLSGGQQQRVAIARLLPMMHPSFWLDEPTGNLDSKTGIDVMKLFVRLNVESGKTIIQVTHERDMALFGSRIITVKDGTIVHDERVNPTC